MMGETVLGEETSGLVEGLLKQGVKNQFIFMRHSARFYGEDPELEPFMGLTPDGQDAALALGGMLGALGAVSTCSSYIGRCLETAYLLREGAGRFAGRHQMEVALSPFYVRDFALILKEILKYDLFAFIRRWCRGLFPPEVISPANEAAQTMAAFAEARIEGPSSGIMVGVTHDWNLFALKEFCLGLFHEECGKVNYLEGVVFYKEAERLMAASHQGEPKDVKKALEAAFKGECFEGRRA